MKRRAVAYPILLGWVLALALGCMIGWPAPVAAAAQDTAPTRGPSGLPLPRFVSLASNEANMRAGPGNRYPIEWVYRRAGLPAEIIAEYDMWRKVRDHTGTEGWMYTSLLSGKRTVLITSERATLHKRARKDSRQLLIAEKGVLAKLLDCKPDWCKVEIDETKGWLRRGTVWGLGANESGR